MADVPQLRYARAVFDETLRLWPTIPFVFRRATCAMSLGDGANGVTLRRGEIVVLSPYVTQRDGRWWDAPEAFVPERWFDETITRPKFASFPFGGGARVCIGEHFATAEAVAILATVAQRWRLRLAADVGRDARVELTAPTRPPAGWRVRVEGR
jgi:cytochrome P450